MSTEYSDKNVYGTESYRQYIETQKYVLNELYLQETEIIPLPDGYSLEITLYADADAHTEMQKCTLMQSGKEVFSYLCNYDHPGVFKTFIHHRNGHRYYPFHVDLYGISYLDLDTLAVFHYIPEGYSHDPQYPCGESFIITAIHYDANTNLIAYGGCYWACPSGVTVCDFSDPLHVHPALLDIREIVDPDEDGYGIDFKAWRDGQLVVTVGKHSEVSVPAAEIMRRLRTDETDKI